MVCACSGCGGWSGTGFLCQKCRDEIREENLKLSVEKLEKENSNLKKELNKLK